MNDFFRGDYNYTGTKGLVFIGNKVLIYRRDEKAPIYPLYLDVPGGGAGPDETPFDTFRREIKEEFGLDVNSEHIVYSDRYKSSQHPNKFGWFAVAKMPTETEGQIEFGNEGIEYMLITLNEFLQREDAWPAYQQRSANYARSVKRISTRD